VGIMKNVAIIILIAILVLVSFLWVMKANLDYAEIKRLKGEQLEKDKQYLENLSELTARNNELQNLLTEQEVKDSECILYEEDYQMFEVTAYTSEECGYITKIGMDLRENYSRYFNIAAVDPEIIPLGSILLIEFSDGTIKPYLACDTGGLIKGNRIDIYMNDVEEALKFGRQMLNVEVIK
jgi:3D (Asp-Asp-Asp) domain-containing protein